MAMDSFLLHSFRFWISIRLFMAFPLGGNISIFCGNMNYHAHTCTHIYIHIIFIYIKFLILQCSNIFLLFLFLLLPPIIILVHPPYTWFRTVVFCSMYRQVNTASELNRKWAQKKVLPTLFEHLLQRFASSHHRQRCNGLWSWQAMSTNRSFEGFWRESLVGRERCLL